MRPNPLYRPSAVAAARTLDTTCHTIFRHADLYIHIRCWKFALEQHAATVPTTNVETSTEKSTTENDPQPQIGQQRAEAQGSSTTHDEDNVEELVPPALAPRSLSTPVHVTEDTASPTSTTCTPALKPSCLLYPSAHHGAPSSSSIFVSSSSLARRLRATLTRNLSATNHSQYSSHASQQYAEHPTACWMASETDATAATVQPTTEVLSPSKRTRVRSNITFSPSPNSKGAFFFRTATGTDQIYDQASNFMSRNSSSINDEDADTILQSVFSTDPRNTS
uniref:Uncharacterized protein n=1 Tax=Lygus hesperus TaxID=30085 RepID=A0A0A9WYV9_LYGHE